MISGAHAVALAMLTATPGCPSVQPPPIAVHVVQQPTVIREDLSKAEMKNFHPDTKLPYQMRDMQHVETGGMMQGDIAVGYKIETHEIPGDTAETVNLSCLRYTGIDVTLALSPVIYVAKDYPRQGCYHDKILEHEQAHVAMDQQVVEKYAARIEDGLKLAFASPADLVTGPVKPRRLKALRQQMMDTVMKATDVLVRDMLAERQRKQQAVDSVQGYAYIMNSCYSGSNVFTPKR